MQVKTPQTSISVTCRPAVVQSVRRTISTQLYHHPSAIPHPHSASLAYPVPQIRSQCHIHSARKGNTTNQKMIINGPASAVRW
ncbi:hypothetical protein COCCADRAFT_104395 [Bipolaris zeicola 26-R-13]|uniref:Uncharacterized protein n=1 Tax=Cochliobolus carbonum (strain 26-R-13) TaxID=930089 RepID=W6XWT4_COCC2|nr:uncharacterized protein COCCADRAFT_104395 [Bipolaris zeicola 26-R-13]EUC30238.1 hypothetical protein COCCADRAFT_104395 [Bipolaris zeicola 26-R-13]